VVRRTKQKLRHSLKEHWLTNAIANKAEVLFLRKWSTHGTELDYQVRS